MNAEQWQHLATAFAGEVGDATPCGLCDVCATVLDVAGAGITLMDGDQVGPLCVTGRGATELEMMQFTLGEGPCHDAFRAGRPVFVPRLDDAAPDRWLAFAQLGESLGIGAVFAFPLTLDDARLGVLTVYQRAPGPLTATQLELCDGLAAVLAASIATMSRAARFGELSPGIEGAIESRAQVHQASGVVAVQLEISPAEALLRIRGYAFASGIAIDQVSGDILARRLVLTDDREHRENEVGQ